jgi:hypothetical protein
MKKIHFTFLFLILQLSLSCSIKNTLDIPEGASLLLDADTLTGASSPTGSCGFTNWSDVSGNSNNATINCAGGGGFAGSRTPADPNRIVFNGTSTYVSTSLNAQSNAMANTTWMAWIKPTNTNFSHVLSIDNHAGAFNRSLIIDNTTSEYGVFNRFNNTWLTSPVDTGSWQFVAVTFSATDLTFYKNGTTYIFGNAPAYSNTAQTFTVGRSAGGAFDFFQGEIAWVAVYPRVLSSTEINTTCRALVTRYAGANCN